jgi:hypothetical protein
VVWRLWAYVPVWARVLPVVIATLLANEPAAAQISSSSWSTDTLSQYLGGDTGARLHDKPVLQSNLNVQFANGGYLNLWGSKSLDRDAPSDNFGNEIDFTVGWTGTVGALGVDLSAAYWALSNPLLFQSRGDAVQLTLELNREFKFGVHTLTPYVKIEPTFPLDASASGGYLHVGLRHKLVLTEGLSFTQGGRIIYDSGVFGNVNGYNLRYDSALVWNLSKNIALRLPTLRAFHPITNLGADRGNAFAFGMGLDVNY